MTLEKVFLALTESQKRDRQEDTETPEDTRIRAEEIFGGIGARKAEEAAAEAPAEAPAPENAPAAEPISDAGKDNNDDYKPLFGGN